MNDYNVNQYQSTLGVEFDWIDVVGDDTKDIRGRRFQCRHPRNSEVSDKTWKDQVANKAPVWLGICLC
jgi:hypothetical protein